jgi:hypothetical protein
MHLTVDNEIYHFEWCDPESPPKIKYYVYKMTYSSVMKKEVQTSEMIMIFFLNMNKLVIFNN